jgi:hypothetical protein
MNPDCCFCHEAEGKIKLEGGEWTCIACYDGSDRVALDETEAMLDKLKRALRAD